MGLDLGVHEYSVLIVTKKLTIPLRFDHKLKNTDTRKRTLAKVKMVKRIIEFWLDIRKFMTTNLEIFVGTKCFTDCFFAKWCSRLRRYIECSAQNNQAIYYLHKLELTKLCSAIIRLALSKLAVLKPS